MRVREHPARTSALALTRLNTTHVNHVSQCFPLLVFSPREVSFCLYCQIIPPLMFYHFIQITLFPLLSCFRSRNRASRTYLIFRKTPKAFIVFCWESCTSFLFYTMHTRTLLSLVSRIKMHNIYFVTLRVKDILFD